MKLLSRLMFIFGCLVMLTTVAGVVLNYSPVPFWDQWDGTVYWYMRAEKNFWPEFWSLHNEHRLLFSRLIFWADMRWFGGVNILSLSANVFTCAVLAFAIFRAALFDVKGAPKLLVAGFSLALCFSWMQSENFTWGFQNQWFAVNLFALLAFHSLAVSASRNYSLVWFVSALAAATASTFSMANGCLSWGLLILLALYWRFDWKFIAAIAAIGLTEIFFYFADRGAVGSLPNGTMSYALQHDPVGFMLYALRYLGSPIWYASNSLAFATLAGALICVTALFWAVAAISNRSLRSMPLLALALFFCGTAFLTAGGRLVTGLGNVFQIRYATNGLLVILVLVLFCAANAKRFRVFVHLSALIATVSVAVCQPAALRPDFGKLFQRKLSGEAIREGIVDTQFLSSLYPDGDHFREVLNQARAEGLTIFAPHVMGLDEPPPPPQIDSHEFCDAGVVERVEESTTSNKMIARGWAVDLKQGRAPKRIVVTDENNQTIGSGIVGENRADVAKVIGAPDPYLGWAAFFEKSKTYRIYEETKANGFCQIK